MGMDWKKGLISGVVAGIVMLVVGTVLMMVAGTSDWYSKTFPEMVSTGGMYSMSAAILVMGVVMGLVYSVINGSIPGEGTRKGVTMESWCGCLQD